MYNLAADSRRSLRPEQDRITISFERFRILRSIAHAAKKHHAARTVQLIQELEALEICELVGVNNNV